MSFLVSQNWRFEDKYPVSYARASALISFLGHHAEIDLHSQEKGYYLVDTVYLDTTELKCYQDSVNGLSKRFKLRLRSYGTTSASRLELKLKENRFSRKLHMPIEHVNGTSSLALPQLPSLPAADEAYLRSQRFRPILSTRYQRQAYFLAGFRVTIDTDFSYARYSSEPHFMKNPDCVLEVKGVGDYPAILSDLLHRHNLKRASYSKYVRAVEELRLA